MALSNSPVYTVTVSGTSETLDVTNINGMIYRIFAKPGTANANTTITIQMMRGGTSGTAEEIKASQTVGNTATTIFNHANDGSLCIASAAHPLRFSIASATDGDDWTFYIDCIQDN